MAPGSAWIQAHNRIGCSPIAPNARNPQREAGGPHSAGEVALPFFHLGVARGRRIWNPEVKLRFSSTPPIKLAYPCLDGFRVQLPCAARPHSAYVGYCR